ncbi:hypothetical protein NE237_017228 [Protea cynaroides]|uniref:Amino acid transporter transmembrane domain-containing protein n=1 Tax=Protea cynaroides TaxID=273540 RepID=A0A9Q0K7M2_9MAGN|nr:hypothetical protein NE237_017228 [Protea cynaroides]
MAEPEINDLLLSELLLPSLEKKSSTTGGGASIAGAVFNVSNNVIGAGIMSIPTTLKVLGIVPAFALILIIAVLSSISVDFLLRFTNTGVSTTYASVMSEAFGRVGSIVFQICIMINNFGTLDIYLIIIRFKESVSFTVHLNIRKTNYYLASIHVTCSKWNGTVSYEVRENHSFELRGALS